ncbi:MAG: hypothetical protein ACLGHX_13140 [Acidimicrobiia bacterium]
MTKLDQLLGWVDRRWVLARVYLAAAAVVLGAFLVEVVGVDGVESGLWNSRRVGGVVVYGMVGVGAGFVLGLVAAAAGTALAILTRLLRWAARVPSRATKWVLRVGARGMTGYALLASYAAVMVLVLAALGEFRADGVIFWVDVFFNGALVALFGGVMGGLSLLIVATWMRDLFARRLPSPTDHEPTMRTLLVIGYVAGAGWLWEWWGPVDHLFAASVAGLDWATVGVAFVVVHGYALLAFGVGKATMVIRARACLLPRLAPESLVWHRGGPVPRRPSEIHWSPEAVIAWRGWDLGPGCLVGHHRQPWKASTMVASCRVGHRRPEWQCNCGIYALKDPSKVDGRVVGRVALEGIVIEHEDGYRAERARIIELWVADEQTRSWVRQRYPDVEVRLGHLALMGGG